MENNGDPANDKKFINKARSYNNAPPMRLKSEPAKRKSFNVNEAVRSLDLALGRLKKSKLVNGEYTTSRALLNPGAQGATEMFMDMCTSSNFSPGAENASLMSMNFSHYELMRNVSRSNCNSDGAVSGNTCSARLSPADLNVKDEHLERYFRSVDMWARGFRDAAPSSLHLDIPEK
ncbi:uncharacterized protein LOC124646273 [Helicoverpa zea]|uniref:uncharacterized protein LOC124646273 n=1 Tax=Helicoverpa zea TaxID=7113 RepID=UPI000DAB2BBA|nr:uncharacterized protein LOC124646273 [Helicoverpa zea]XP_049706433.1 uncharacterized protein LOC126056714 [Helicoverpa armigera]PZC83348.1 hypothetical protein B5X24_HaOG208112 [Helicoverpa armigera]